MKTLVTAAHAHGPYHNGYDGCDARIPTGMCPGVNIAQWLNALGEDEDVLTVLSGESITNGNVRDNYLHGNYHVVPVNTECARLMAEKREAERTIARINRRLAELNQ